MRLHRTRTLPFSLSLLPVLHLTNAQAPLSQNNPADASIQASLFAFNPIQGTITGVTPTNGTGTSFNINFFDFPSSTSSPFTYYISSATSIPDGNCSSLLEPFNPYSASSSTCKPSDPANCPIGALSAKHSSIHPTSTSYSFQVFYTDAYLSTAPGAEAYFGGRAIVIADKSGKPVNCGLFPGTPSKQSGSGTSSGSATASATSSGAASMTSASTAAAAASSTAAAERMGGAGGGVVFVAGLVVALVV